MISGIKNNIASRAAFLNVSLNKMLHILSGKDPIESEGENIENNTGYVYMANAMLYMADRFIEHMGTEFEVKNLSKEQHDKLINLLSSATLSRIKHRQNPNYKKISWKSDLNNIVKSVKITQ